MNETRDKAAPNQVQPLIIPSRGGFFSREVLKHQSQLNPEDMGSGMVTVVFVNSVLSTQQPDEVRAKLEPLLQACNASFITLEAGQRTVAQTIVEYAHAVNAPFIKTASLTDLNGESREGPTVLEMYEHIRSCHVLTINVTPPEVTRA